MQETDPNAPPASESAEAARERRLRALRALASQQLGADAPAGGGVDVRAGGRAAAGAAAPASTPPDAPAAPPAPERPRRRGRALRIGVGVIALCVVVVAVGVFNGIIPLKLPFNRQAPASLPPITTRSITPLTDGMTCYADATWAPTGELLAVLGYQRGCPNIFNTGTFSTGMIIIYNAATGKPKSQFMLDQLLTSQSNFPPNAQIIHYQNLLWSPDGKRLAITYVAEAYSVDANNNFAPLVLAAGVLLVNVDGSHPQVIVVPGSSLNPVVPNVGVSTGDIATISGIEVDLTTGKLLTAPSLLPSAVAYRWGANGQLTAVTDAAAGMGAVGSPSGSQQFSVWQPGALEPGLSSTDPTVPGNIQTIPNLYLWNTSVAAWSPGGRYLYSPLSISRRIQLPGATAPTTNIPNELSADSGVTIAAHDAAQVGLYLPLTVSGETAVEYSEGFLPTTDVAWQPDGRVLAAQPLIGAVQNVTALTLYNCATGKVIMKLAHDTQGTEIFQDNTGTRVGDGLVRWSPDGAHLALADPGFGTVTFWAFNTPLV